MRAGDDVALPPEAIARIKRERHKTLAGLVIAAAGLLAVFMLKEVYIGFTVALIGAGLAPVDKLIPLLKR